MFRLSFAAVTLLALLADHFSSEKTRRPPAPLPTVLAAAALCAMLVAVCFDSFALCDLFF